MAKNDKIHILDAVDADRHRQYERSAKCSIKVLRKIYNQTSRVVVMIGGRI